MAYNGWSRQRELLAAVAGHGQELVPGDGHLPLGRGRQPGGRPGAEALIGGEGYSYGVCGRGMLLLIAK